MSLKRKTLMGLAVFGLVACGDPFPEDFTIAVDGTDALGFYQPAEFSEAEIMMALGRLCPSGISNFTSDPGTDSTTFFGANCAAGYNVNTGSVYITRTADGGLSYDLP